jgi:uncharacterized protein
MNECQDHPSRWRQYATWTREFITHRVLHADDPPHRLALGVAIGVFVTFTPTVGFQMVIAVFLAWWLRANKAVGVPVVWISNPATFVPIYYSCYWVGRHILGKNGIGRAWWAELTRPPEGWWPAVTFYWSRFTEIAWPLWIGGFIVGGACEVVSYYLVYHLIRAYRLRRWGQLLPPSATAAMQATKATSDPSMSRVP